MLLDFRRGAMTPKKQRILPRRGFKMTVVSMKAAIDAEEILYFSASRQQNMHFDLKSALDAEDMSVSSASYSASNNQISQQRSGKPANQVSRQYPDQLRTCRGQGCRYEEKMLLDFRKGSHDAEETANSSASWVQNDCCEHESSPRRRRNAVFFRVPAAKHAF